MNIKEIKQLLILMKEFEVSEFELEREGTKISLKKYSSSGQIVHQPQIITQPVAQTNVEQSVQAVQVIQKNSNFKTITSPIVGTYYSSPSPEAPPYMSVGTKVTPNDTVCIIEAMKVMNEIKAEMSGVIEEILVQNGQAVEFGQILFKVRPL